jgi:flagellar biosynthesis protein FlhB
LADQGQKTEQPTQQRLTQTRREGQFPVSRDFIAVLQFSAVVIAILAFCRQGTSAFMDLWRTLFERSLQSQELTLSDALALYRNVVFPFLSKALLIGLAILGLVLLVQLATTGFGLASSKLMPDFKRLNTFSRIKQMPKDNAQAVLRSVIMMVLVTAYLYSTIADQLGEISQLALVSLSAALTRSGELIGHQLRQICLVLFVIGTIDLVRQRRKFTKNLRMTKQEVKDEMKQSDGNPETKARVRRLQRDAARKNMIKAVKTATVVITNPTHYAIAIKYEMGSRSVPTVVAKGKNYLAKVIRERAREHDIPIIENKPLAQALYQTADVGNEIPSALYRAVAEVLAQIYRIINRQ